MIEKTQLERILDRIEEIIATSELEGASDAQRRLWLRTMLHRELAGGG